MIKRLLLTLGVILAGCQTAAERAQDDREKAAPELNLAGTIYAGVQQGATEAFLGVAFAQPPVGEHRWAAPRPIKQAVTGSVDASRYAPACMQGPHIVKWYRSVIESFGGEPESFTAPPVSEDCLYLNVWRPTGTSASEKLPIYVFIHGGSNKGGWAYEPNYHGDKLAARGAIVITIAYRLGVFGYFANPDLEQVNFGLLDQIAALRWIQQHARQLGGDPDNITVSGESSGASNIAYLLASPLARGLFQKVVHQSAGWAMQGGNALQPAQKLAQQLSDALLPGVDNGVAELRQLPAQAVLSAAEVTYKDHFFDPLIDGHSVVNSVPEVAANGGLAPVDMIVGSNANEALMYLDAGQSLDQLIDSIGAADRTSQIKTLLAAAASEVAAKDRLASAANYACPSLLLADAVEHNGGRVWMYYFARQRSGPQGALMGAYHGIELPYIFATHDHWLPTDAADLVITNAMADYWLAFMQSGDPNTKQRHRWPAYAKMNPQVLNLATPISSQQHPDRVLCSLLNR
ncbi:MAG: carboxylesterase family protein [Gammaproteobacteria bacterium]|nr:carboxylesterase family protein [Gammaproteobacteria bacterium]